MPMLQHADTAPAVYSTLQRHHARVRPLLKVPRLNPALEDAHLDIQSMPNRYCLSKAPVERSSPSTRARLSVMSNASARSKPLVEEIYSPAARLRAEPRYKHGVQNGFTVRRKCQTTSKSGTPLL